VVASDTYRSASAAVKQSGGECIAATSADPELVPQTADEFETRSEQGCRTESPSVTHESHCSGSSPDIDKEAESSTLDGSSSHMEDEGEGEETDTCSSPPSEAENVDIETSAVKKPKIS
jgi:hypothetical protein